MTGAAGGGDGGPGRTRAFLGLGSNLGDRVRYLRDAVATLREVGLVAVSPVYETDPVGGPPDQDPYLNLVVELRTDRSAHELLGVCRRLETAAGRGRNERRGARTRDGDGLWGDGVPLDEPELKVPHPRMAGALPVIDQDCLDRLRQLDDQDGFVADVINDFLEDADQLVRQIAQAAGELRHQHITEITHRLDSADAARFAASLAQLADSDAVAVMGPDLPRTDGGSESPGQYLKRFRVWNEGSEPCRALFAVYVRAEVNGGVSSPRAPGFSFLLVGGGFVYWNVRGPRGHHLSKGLVM